jgi:hypothetical protein
MIKWVENNPTKKIFYVKRAGAKRKGIEFTLQYEDVVWPDHCPVLGNKIDYSRFRGNGNKPMPNSPSFDRIDHTKGYTPDNVIIVSNKANIIKSNSNVDELERVASYYRQLIPPLGASHV